MTADREPWVPPPLSPAEKHGAPPPEPETEEGEKA